MSSDSDVEIFDAEAIEERDSQVEEGEPDVPEDEQDLSQTAAVDEFLLGEGESDSDSTFVPDQDAESADEELAPENTEEELAEVIAELGEEGAEAIMAYAEEESVEDDDEDKEDESD